MTRKATRRERDVPLALAKGEGVGVRDARLRGCFAGFQRSVPHPHPALRATLSPEGEGN
jgi:hypothetical protein